MAVEAAPRRELWFRGKEVVQEGFVDLHRGVRPGKVRETRGLAGSDELFRRPNVLGCGPCKEVAPVGVLGFLNRLEVSLPRKPSKAHEVIRTVLFSQPACLGVFLSQGSEGGVHHGFDLGEGREIGVWRRMVAVRESREWANHVSSWSGEGERGGGGCGIL